MTTNAAGRPRQRRVGRPSPKGIADLPPLSSQSDAFGRPLDRSLWPPMPAMSHNATDCDDREAGTAPCPGAPRPPVVAGTSCHSQSPPPAPAPPANAAGQSYPPPPKAFPGTAPCSWAPRTPAVAGGTSAPTCAQASGGDSNASWSYTAWAQRWSHGGGQGTWWNTNRWDDDEWKGGGGTGWRQGEWWTGGGARGSGATPVRHIEWNNPWAVLH